MNPSKPATDSPARTIESRPGRTVVDPAVAEESKKQREQRLIALFNKFDVKRNGLLEFTHIHAMVKAIMIPTSSTKKKESSNIANVILQSLDKVRFVSIVSFFGLSSLVVVVVVVCCCLLFASLSSHFTCPTHSTNHKQDKSGGVDKEEFVAWVSKGALLQPEQRRMFAEGGTVQKAILNFLEGVEDCLKTPAPSRSSAGSAGSGGTDGTDGMYTTTNAISDVVKNLFQTFDVDQDGHIE